MARTRQVLRPVAFEDIDNFDPGSPLTEMSDDDEEDQLAPPPPPTRTPVAPIAGPSSPPKKTRPSTQQSTKQSKSGTWPNPLIPIVTYCNKSVGELVSLMTDKHIELEPEYQRGIVWTDEKQSKLIESLYHGFLPPQLVFATFTQDDGVERHICIDGKQRLTSIKRFFAGELPLANQLSERKRKAYVTKTPGTRRSILPETVIGVIKRRNIAIVQYQSLNDELQRELFQRIQYGVPLGPADRLPAINGPWADIVRSVRQRIYTTKHLDTLLKWGEARGKDFQALANALYLAVHSKDKKIQEPTSVKVEAWLSSTATSDQIRYYAEALQQTMDIYCRILLNQELRDALQSGVPTALEFIVGVYVVFLYRDQLSDTQLADAIDRMRNRRQTSRSKKTGADAFKSLMTFARTTLPKIIFDLNQDRHGNIPAAQTPYYRVGIDDDDEEDDEYDQLFSDSEDENIKMDVDSDVPLRLQRPSASKVQANTSTSRKPSSKRARQPLTDEEDEAETIPVKKAKKMPNIKQSASMTPELPKPSTPPPPPAATSKLKRSNTAGAATTVMKSKSQATASSSARPAGGTSTSTRQTQPASRAGKVTSTKSSTSKPVSRSDTQPSVSAPAPVASGSGRPLPSRMGQASSSSASVGKLRRSGTEPEVARPGSSSGTTKQTAKPEPSKPVALAGQEANKQELAMKFWNNSEPEKWDVSSIPRDRPTGQALGHSHRPSGLTLPSSVSSKDSANMIADQISAAMAATPGASPAIPGVSPTFLNNYMSGFGRQGSAMQQGQSAPQRGMTASGSGNCILGGPAGHGYPIGGDRRASEGGVGYGGGGGGMASARIQDPRRQYEGQYPPPPPPSSMHSLANVAAQQVAMKITGRGQQPPYGNAR